MCVEWIVAPLGRPTAMLCVVGILLVQGVEGPRKWLVQPESAMARQWGEIGRGAGTTELENRICKVGVLDVVVPCSFQRVRLAEDPPLVSALVACVLLLCLSESVSYNFNYLFFSFDTLRSVMNV